MILYKNKQFCKHWRRLMLFFLISVAERLDQITLNSFCAPLYQLFGDPYRINICLRSHKFPEAVSRAN